MSKKNIAVKLEVNERIPSISGDSNQLEHVLMNLVVNAGDAMPDGGTITIATSVADLERNARTVHPLLTPGKYVLMTVSDSGTGIPDNIKDKVFDPFFTTKQTGKGTGLGLAMVYGIVKDHGGVINLKSQLGKGTTFEIYLPASGKVIPRVDRVALYTITGREKVLVIDDEADILSFIKDVLETQGYRVLTADNPVHALDIFRKVGEDIDLVITDIVMPLLNGRELLRQIREIKPGIRTIAVSGYDIWNIGRKDKDIDAYIRKPFEGIYLLSIVRRVLDSAGSPSGSRNMPL
jgi:CheY-like chemotaxis protein